MTTNPFFNPYNYSNEQELLRSLNKEAIQMHGIDMFYLPRRRNNYDGIYGADDMSSFDTAYTLEFYTESYEGFGGDRSFMEKFGVEIREQIFFSVARERFNEIVTQPDASILRPREGDLIYFPLYKACFEIKYVDDKQPAFYATGILPLYRMTCELFEYSSEKFETGNEDIDSIMEHSLNIYDHGGTVNANGVVTMPNTYNIDILDPLSDNEKLKSNTGFIDFSETNPWGDIDH